MSDAAREKEEVRRRVLAARESMPSELRREASARIVEGLLGYGPYVEAESVFAFHPFASEPDIRPFLEAVLRQGKRLWLPRLKGGSMSIVEAPTLTGLERGPLGIMQPGGGGLAGEPKELDLLVIPGVAFSPGLERLGYGGGHMDRLLAKAGAVSTVGVAFELQLLDDLPTGPLDRPVAALMTEAGLRLPNAGEPA